MYQRELLASKILEIGQSMLKSVSRGPRDADSAECQRAVQWIQKAFAMAEQLADTATPGVAELKVCGEVQTIAHVGVLVEITLSA